MALETKNNVETSLKADLSDTGETTVIVKTWEGGLFPATGTFRITIEQFLTISWVTYIKKREIIEITSRTGDILTIWTRTVESCVQDETVDIKTLTSVEQAFNWWDKVSLYLTAGKSDEVDTELLRLEGDKTDQTEYDAFVIAISALVNANTALAHSHANKAILDAIQQAFTTALKDKLDGIAVSANNYSLPIATTLALWGVKPDWVTVIISWGWIISSVSGGWGVGSNFWFPHAKTWLVPFAKQITDLVSYTPPAWKVAYITICDAPYQWADVNGILMWLFWYNAGQGRVGLVRPLILDDGDSIDIRQAWQAGSVAGFEVDADADITPITVAGAYTVPAWFNYIISNLYSLYSTAGSNLFTIWGINYNGFPFYNQATTDVAEGTENLPILWPWDSVNYANLNHNWYLVPIWFIS